MTIRQPIGPRDFLKSGHKLLENRNEIDYRNSASRTYYGAYHQCLLLTKKLGIKVRPGNGKGYHAALIFALQDYPKSGTATSKLLSPEKQLIVKQCGKYLSKIKRSRFRADYQLDNEFKQSEARRALSLSNQLIGEAENLIKTFTQTNP